LFRFVNIKNTLKSNETTTLMTFRNGMYNIQIEIVIGNNSKYEGWNFNSGNYLFTTDTK